MVKIFNLKKCFYFILQIIILLVKIIQTLQLQFNKLQDIAITTPAATTTTHTAQSLDTVKRKQYRE